jgi:hypothetical protein
LYSLQQNATIVRKMKALVPEFISQNSIYEELDYEQQHLQTSGQTSSLLSPKIN